MDLRALGVTPAKQQQFGSRGIYDAKDLVMYLPRRYNDLTKETGLLPEEEISCVVAVFKDLRTFRTSGRTLVRADCAVSPTGERLSVTWFNQPWMANKLRPLLRKSVYIAGKAKYDPGYHNWSMNAPEVFALDEAFHRAIMPVYRKIPRMSQEYLREKLDAALSYPENTAEVLPTDVLKAHGQISRQVALLGIHHPASMSDVEKGWERLLFDDLLYFALNTVWAGRMSSQDSPYTIRTTHAKDVILQSLPYALTPDQCTAVAEMIATGQSGRRIYALLQGDVGCGKSIVAFLMMALMAENGYQAAIMAPTQVLARQHYEDLTALVEPLGYRVAFLGSGGKKAEREKVLEDIASGAVQMVVGTHAVISKDVAFHDLALVITDEEHRFGVLQREALLEKAASGVHSITMSATPIPRSLAQVIYGDALQLITIKTMPADRKPVLTSLDNGREKIYKFIIKQSALGHQVYVVCPMIDKNEDMEGVKSVEEVSAEYKAALEPYGVQIETLTGRNTKEETEEILDRFKRGETSVLIATTVVEVGVNVPTATAIIISNAERFGLASLHQLRGRVGRSDLQSYCVLECDRDVLAEDTVAAARLEALCRTNDGFEIAQADLRLRGAGDFIGTAQSGDNKYISLMLAYPEKYATARKIAAELLDREDPCPFVQEALQKEQERKEEG